MHSPVVTSASGSNTTGVQQQQVDKVQTQAMVELQQKLARLEEKQEEAQRAAALGAATIAKSKANLETSMRDLEASMHERSAAQEAVGARMTSPLRTLSQKW